MITYKLEIKYKGNWIDDFLGHGAPNEWDTEDEAEAVFADYVVNVCNEDGRSDLWDNYRIVEIETE